MQLPPKTDCALIIVGHGSTENPDSSAPTHQHADVIRDRGVFGEVQCAFWKEEPSLRQVHTMVDQDVIYVVPNFISEGYFTREVIPRELELEGPTTQIHGKTLHYCDPVGVHPSMTDLLEMRAKEIAPDVDPAESALIIVGHGTNLNSQSTEAIRQQVARLRERNLGYQLITDAYMEEAPYISHWDELTEADNVIVVPFFIADGLHSYQDIPVLLGIETETGDAASQTDVFRQNPIRLRGRDLYYSRAIGTDASVAQVILDQVADFHRDDHA